MVVSYIIEIIASWNRTNQADEAVSRFICGNVSYSWHNWNMAKYSYFQDNFWMYPGLESDWSS
jgi:hypothetical protein